MQIILLITLLIFNVDLIAAKSTAGKTSSTYHYTRTSNSNVAGGYYLVGMNSGGHYHRKSGCTNSNTQSCGQDAPASEGETERIYAFKEGTCASHTCQPLNNRTECELAAVHMEDTTWIMENTCSDGSKCSMAISKNEVRWCEGATSNSCTADRQCLCKCVVGTDSSSVDVGLILGITFGCLFGCCLLVGIWQYSRMTKY
jgi:hypothetical protein